MPAQAPRKLLIVDDDADVRDVLTSFLAADGYAADGIANGQEALDHLRAATELPLLIVLDLRMRAGSATSPQRDALHDQA